MQKLFWIPGITLLIMFSACHNLDKAKQFPSIAADTAQDAQTIFPVTEFLLGQIKELDGMPITPLKITIHDNKRDSVWLQRKDIAGFAKPFLTPIIDSATMTKYFSEKSFMDQTINAVTLTYDPKVVLPDSMKLNHWDVYITPQKNTVQRIYLVKETEENGQTVTTQLTWEAGKWCSVRTITQETKMPPDVKEEILKWDFDD